MTILGGGPGGFAAALRARKEYGLSTVLVEKEAIGGVCLHRGCIPTKSFLTDALLLKPYPEIVLKKEKIVSRLHQGALATLRKESVSVIQGAARILKEHLVQVGQETIETKFILIATGSRPRELPGTPFDGEKILSSDDLLKIKEIPKSLLIIGAGPTGCEFASLFNLLGCELVGRVTVVEAASRLLPNHDEEISEALKKIFVRLGIEVRLNQKAAVEKESAEKILVSIGRIPNSQDLGLEALGVLLKDGFISVDDHMRTAIPSIFAVGDVIGKWPLAHVASHQGEIAVDVIAGKNRTAEPSAIPECVFTVPEIARVGLTEKEAREKRREVLVGRSSFITSARALMLDEKEGFVKLIGDAKNGQLLGAHLLGPHVTELLSELTLAVRLGLSIREIEETIHPHPTLSESVEEAASDFMQQWKGHGAKSFSGISQKAD